MLADSSVGQAADYLHLKRESALAAAQALIHAGHTFNSSELRRLGERIEACATSFFCKVIDHPGQPSRLYIRASRYTCRSRLCCLCCAWRPRLMRQRINTLLEVHWATPGHDADRTIFFTMTRPLQTCATASILPLKQGLKAFWKADLAREHILGFVQSIEASVSKERDSDGLPKLHFHAHCTAMVRPSYFAKGYPAVHQKRWAALWTRANQSPVPLILDVRALKGPNGETDHASVLAATVEAVKYAIATKDLFNHADGRISADPRVLAALRHALHRKRLVTYAGCFKAAEKRLRQQQKETPTDSTTTSTFHDTDFSHSQSSNPPKKGS